MSDWDELIPPAKSGPVKDPVRFSLRKIRGSRARGVILLTRETVASLGMKTWRVNVRLGKGARAHQIALVPDPDGRFELCELGTAKGGGTFRLTLPVVDRFPDVASPVGPAKWRVEAEAKRQILVIDLPPFCWDAGSRAALVRGRAA